MSAPTLDEMKLAVAKMLPRSLQVSPFVPGEFIWRDGEYAHANLSECPIVTEREWLHVCWMVGETLTSNEWDRYGVELGYYDSHPPAGAGVKQVLHHTVERLITALCRVRCPEMFREPPQTQTPPESL